MKRGKMKRVHTREYVMKILDEFNYTLMDARRQVREFTGRDMFTYEVVGYLQHCPADYMRMVLRFNTFRKEQK